MASFAAAQRTPFDTAAIGLSSANALALLLIGSWLLPAGAFTALLAVILIAYLLMSPGAANGAAFRVALPFLVMALWGLAMSRGNERYDVVKDFWYAGKICLCLMVGFLVGVRCLDSRIFLRILIGVALVMALVKIALWAIYGTTVGELDGESTAALPLVAVAAIVPLLDRIRTGRGLARGGAGTLLVVILFAVLVSNSRNTIIAALMMVLAWIGLFSKTSRTLIGGIIVVGLLVILWQFLPEYTGGDLTVAVKFRRSLEEVLFTDNFNASQMILNWRGFEAYNAQLMFDNSSLFDKILGNGLGATVDIGQEVMLTEDTSFRFLPILHNGYYYVIIKYGLLGALIYVLSVLRFGLIGQFARDHMTIEDRMLRGLIIIILQATTVITGLYNKSALDGMAILVAFLMGFAQRYRYETSIRALPAPAGGVA